MKNKYSKLKSFRNYFKRKDIAASGCVIKFGNRGCGKSTDIAKEFLRYHKAKLKKKCQYDYFYTNVKINTDDPTYKYLDLNDYNFTDYIDPALSSTYKGFYTEADTPFKIQRNSIIMLDEVALLWHQRSWKSMGPEVTKFIKLIRHFGIYMTMYSQNYDIDKTLRNGANELYLLTKIGFITMQRKIKKYIGVSDKDENGNADSQIVDKVELCGLLEPNALSFTLIPFYTDLFDSYN